MPTPSFFEAAAQAVETAPLPATPEIIAEPTPESPPEFSVEPILEAPQAPYEPTELSQQIESIVETADAYGIELPTEALELFNQLDMAPVA